MALAMNRVTLALLLLVVAAAVFVLVPQDDDEVAVHSISCSPAASDAAALGLSWVASPGAELYDVHISLSNAWRPFLSVTSAEPTVAVSDLPPGTAFLLAVRSRGPRPQRWSPLGPRRTCSTPTVAQHIRPPQGPPRLDAVVVHFAIATRAGWALFHRQRGSPAPFTKTEVPPGRRNVTISGLLEGRAYEVYLEESSGEPPGPVVLHHTSSPDIESFEVCQ